MSGHSKWATIKHQKGAADAKRGKLFSRIAKAIAVAVREGGNDDPEFNPRLRMEVDRARAANMPKDNIQRAIDKGAGRVAGASYESLTYEGFAPKQVAVIVECVTDNRNRTAAEIKSLFDKNEGAFGSPGSVSYNFGKKGALEVILPENMNKDDAELDLIDLGAEDIQSIDEKKVVVYVDPSNTHAAAQAMKEKGYTVESAEIVMVPTVTVPLNEKEFAAVQRFLDILDDHEDVQNFYHNAHVESSTV